MFEIVNVNHVKHHSNFYTLMMIQTPLEMNSYKKTIFFSPANIFKKPWQEEPYAVRCCIPIRACLAWQEILTRVVRKSTSNLSSKISTIAIRCCRSRRFKLERPLLKPKSLFQLPAIAKSADFLFAKHPFNISLCCRVKKLLQKRKPKQAP